LHRCFEEGEIKRPGAAALSATSGGVLFGLTAQTQTQMATRLAYSAVWAILCPATAAKRTGRFRDVKENNQNIEILNLYFISLSLVLAFPRH
jgi:hypothetical protein